MLNYERGALISGQRVTTMLPADLIKIGNAMCLHVMVCEDLGDVRWTELHRSSDNGETWEPTGIT